MNDKAPDGDRPLVSFCMVCYNGARYVRAALQSILDQTYDPLEIVVCDDCSTDGTDRIVAEMLDDYRRGGGGHEVRFRRNESNLGILRNYEQCFRMGRGELLVTGSHDDIQMPDRVERTVDAWVRGGRRAGLVICGMRCIDEDGKFLYDSRPWGKVSALGAASAYVKAVAEGFPELERNDAAYEDHVFSARAVMFGPELLIDEPLFMYRRGSGPSTPRGFRMQRTRITRHVMESLALSESDLRFARDVLRPPCLKEAEELVEKRRRRFTPEFRLVTGRTVGERWRGYRGLCPGNGWNLGWRMKAFYYLPLVLPFHIGDAVTALYEIYGKARKRMRK